MVLVDEHRHFRHQRIDTGDLAEHAAFVDDRRAGLDAVGVDEGQHLVGSGGRDGGHGHMAGEAGVAGGTQDGRDLRITLEPPGQGVFASTASKDENAHDSCRERLW